MKLLSMLNLSKLSFKPNTIVMFTLLFSLFSVSQVAEAKRFGGGGSFGYSKQVAPKSYNTAPKAAPTKPAANAGTATRPASGASKWLGPLAGLAAGGLLAAMLFGDGFEGLQMFDILLFALVAFVLFKLFASAKRRQADYAYQEMATPERASSQNTPAYQQQAAYREMRTEAQNTPHQASIDNGGSIIGADLEDGMGQGLSDNAQYLNEIPAWFDQQGFVDGAKSHFMALQKAWDNVDLSEIESYCTPELYQALQQELRGVQPGDNQTVVDTLYAEIAAMAVDAEYFVVSIRFSGFIQEDTVQGAHAFNEIWHIRRLANDEGNWQVAGIQQVSGSL
ncbi:hypothetical protein THMIRHAM_02590 [Thiomicrorhabdus immobilis]|uniref:Tim44-like domain-containing protein n=2 Tax=Thiomicrorhabdus immobilis TaxID=2791037 RepID=A0ABM7MAV1_9GAMM|nr:hypothetical protein THMIRHAM_02590 [Thiomicrorhabdus immobilis]